MGGRGSFSQRRHKKTISTAPKGQRIPHPMDIAQFQGMSLQDVEDRIRGLSHEELFVLDKDDKIIAAYKGNSTSVAFPGRILFQKDITVTHGHPKGAEGYGATFSITDVLNMAASNWKEHRAAASGSNELNYIIRRTAKNTSQNSRDLYDRVMRDKSDLENRINRAAQNADKRGLSATARRQVYTGILDKYYSQVLPQYNFEYVARNKSYRYNR